MAEGRLGFFLCVAAFYCSFSLAAQEPLVLPACSPVEFLVKCPDAKTAEAVTAELAASLTGITLQNRIRARSRAFPSESTAERSSPALTFTCARVCMNHQISAGFLASISS